MKQGPAPPRPGRAVTAIARLRRAWSALTRPGATAGEFARPANAPLLAPAAELPERPLVSVIMTSYNTAAFVSEAVDSILRQSWQRLELIVVDDASEDDSLARLRALEKADDRLRVIPLDANVGTYRAKNVAIGSARGDVLTFMDSDDTSKPGRLEQQLEVLRGPGIVATTCNYVRHTRSGEILLNRGLPERRALISLMIKRQVIDDIGWFDSVRTSADDEFFERIRTVYGRAAVAHVDAALYFALKREASLSTTPDMTVDLATFCERDPSPLAAVRQSYVQSYREWYTRLASSGMRPYMPSTSTDRRAFPADSRLTR